MQALFPGGRGRRISGLPVLFFVAAALGLYGCGPTDRAPALELASPKPAETASAPERSASTSDHLGPKPESSQPDVTLTNEQQLRQILDAARGKILVVNVWATWCLPCIAEMPVLAAFYQSMDRDRVTFLSLSADAGYTLDDAVKPFAKEHALPFPVHVLNFKDPDPVKLAAMLGVSETGWDGALPATFVLDADGTLTKYWLEELKSGELTEALKSVTGKTASAK